MVVVDEMTLRVSRWVINVAVSESCGNGSESFRQRRQRVEELERRIGRRTGRLGRRRVGQVAHLNVAETMAALAQQTACIATVISSPLRLSPNLSCRWGVENARKKGKTNKQWRERTQKTDRFLIATRPSWRFDLSQRAWKQCQWKLAHVRIIRTPRFNLPTFSGFLVSTIILRIANLSRSTVASNGSPNTLCPFVQYSSTNSNLWVNRWFEPNDMHLVDIKGAIVCLRYHRTGNYVIVISAPSIFQAVVVYCLTLMALARLRRQSWSGSICSTDRRHAPSADSVDWSDTDRRPSRCFRLCFTPRHQFFSATDVERLTEDELPSSAATSASDAVDTTDVGSSSSLAVATVVVSSASGDCALGLCVAMATASYSELLTRRENSK